MSKTIAIFSTKGGVGKTFLASNLAVAMARQENKKVLLIDLDLQVPTDMARVLNVNPTRSIVDLISQLKKQATNIHKEDFINRTGLGVDFLPAVLAAQQAHHIQPDKIKSIFALFEQGYDYIIVDTGKVFSDSLIQTLNQANLILLMVTPDILSVYQAKWALDTLQFLHFPLRMVKIVLNRAESFAAISWQEVTAALVCEIIARIPSEGRVVMQSLGRGVMAVIDSPRSRISQAIGRLANQLVTQENLFVEHKEVDGLLPHDFAVKETGEFWKDKGIADTLQFQRAEEEIDEFLKFKRRIHQRLIDDLNLKKMDPKLFNDPKKNRELKNRAEKLVSGLLVEEGGSFITSSEVRQKLIKEIMDDVLGLGPLEDLLNDPEITDIMVNNKDEVFIERWGKIELTPKKFISNEQVRTVIERIISPLGRHIDESTPMVDARLPDGSRVNAIIPPLSLSGPVLTIRKFREEIFSSDQLVHLNSISPQMVEFLKACVLARKNLVVSGGTGSGKTTVLNILSTFIPDTERIVTIEDAAELKLRQQHWIRLETRSPNIEGRGAITTKDLFRNTLRMRPDRIIIGECRGVETLDMLQAMNTGHDGSMTTVHANTTQDVLSRVDSMILMTGVELPIKAIREMIASAVNLIIHTARLSDGSRKIVQISEVSGMKDDVHVNMQDIFVFRQTGIDSQGKVLGEFKASGYIPSFVQEMKVKGSLISEDIFKP